MRVLSKDPDKRPDNAEAHGRRADARQGERRSSPAACAPRSSDALGGRSRPCSRRRAAVRPLLRARCPYAPPSMPAVLQQRHAQRAGRLALARGVAGLAPTAAIAVMLAAAIGVILYASSSRQAPAAPEPAATTQAARRHRRRRRDSPSAPGDRDGCCRADLDHPFDCGHRPSHHQQLRPRAPGREQPPHQARAKRPGGGELASGGHLVRRLRLFGVRLRSSCLQALPRTLSRRSKGAPQLLEKTRKW